MSMQPSPEEPEDHLSNEPSQIRAALFATSLSFSPTAEPPPPSSDLHRPDCRSPTPFRRRRPPQLLVRDPSKRLGTGGTNEIKNHAFFRVRAVPAFGLAGQLFTVCPLVANVDIPLMNRTETHSTPSSACRKGTVGPNAIPTPQSMHRRTGEGARGPSSQPVDWPALLEKKIPPPFKPPVKVRRRLGRGWRIGRGSQGFRTPRWSMPPHLLPGCVCPQSTADVSNIDPTFLANNPPPEGAEAGAAEPPPVVAANNHLFEGALALPPPMTPSVGRLRRFGFLTAMSLSFKEFPVPI